MRKYICDNCGQEFESLVKELEKMPCGRRVEMNLEKLGWQSFDDTQDFGELEIVGEYCQQCKKKIEARIKEGVQ